MENRTEVIKLFIDHSKPTKTVVAIDEKGDEYELLVSSHAISNFQHAEVEAIKIN